MSNLYNPKTIKIVDKSYLLFIIIFLVIACKQQKKQVSEQEFNIYPSIASTDNDLPVGFEQNLVLSGLRSPSTMTFSPDGRLFIGERIQGELRVLKKDGTLLSDPVVILDIPKNEKGVPTRHNSSGIRGFTFDPNFPEEPFIYIFYMKHKPRHNRISRFTISEKNPNQVVPGSEKVLLKLPFNEIGSSGSHNGGAVIFGQDGKLYITTGDGWQAHDNWEGGEPVQSLKTFTGKVFRINKNGTIPQNNPFYEQTTGDYRAIYALGLRNPFSMSRHPISGQIYINDASMSDGTPEKDHILKLFEAGNYMWERPEHNDPWQPSDPGTPQNPYARAGDRVITGGAWYPTKGGSFPEKYHGNYFIPLWGANDSRPGSIVRMISETDTRIETFLPVAGDGMEGMGKPVYTKVGPEGSLYWLATTYETEEGSVFKVSYSRDKEKMERLAMPMINPNGGTFPYPVDIRFTAQTTGERIYYTIDGSVPDENSQRYTEPFALTKSADLNIRAFKEGMSASHIATASFNIYEDKKAPQIKSVFVKESNQIQIQFDEAVDEATAESTLNYRIVPKINIKKAVLGNDYKTVTLQTSTDITDNRDYTLYAKGLSDRAKPGNKIKDELKSSIAVFSDKRGVGIEEHKAVKPYLNMPYISDGNIPSLLSQTGVFDDTFTLTPASGVIPYTVNTPQWNDGTVMQRWIALPSDPSNPKSLINFSLEDPWDFPPGTVFARHVGLTVDENSNNSRRLETQILVADSTGGFYGVTYKWRKNGREADLVSENQSISLSILKRNGEKRKQMWQVNDGTCMACHTAQAGYVLGVNTRQLNKDFFYFKTGKTNNQLQAWDNIDLFSQKLKTAQIHSFPQLLSIDNREASIEDRVRSYLDANCSSCHRPGGVVGPQLDLRFKVELQNQGLVGGDVNNIFGIKGTKAIVPGSLNQSLVYKRMNTKKRGLRMPVYSRRIDTNAVKVLSKWIKNLK